jgi:hypothetical protein
MTELLEKFGFSFNRGGAHSARTMMFSELEILIDYFGDEEITKEAIEKAIIDENCLSKRSSRTRTLTYRHLAELYVLDPSICLFRSLLFYWKRDPASRPMLALLASLSRDPLLQESMKLTLSLNEGQTLSRQAVEEDIEHRHPDRFSPASLKSIAQNLNSTWTQSGHLQGKAKKTRACALATEGSVAFALLLNHLEGSRGTEMFRTPRMKVLDCGVERAMELAESASRKGLMVFKKIGSVVEVQFPELLTSEEEDWLRE